MTHRARVAFAVHPFIIAGALAFASASQATTIPEVELTRDGPLSTFPSGGAFYLQGDEDKATRVRAVFVRTRAGAFGKATPCDELSTALGTLARAANQPFAVFEQPMGRYMPSQVWVAPDKGEALERFNGLDDDSVYLPPVWTAPKEPKKFKILVDNAPFFRPGSHHCLFVYRENLEVKSLNADVAKLVLHGSRAYAECERKLADERAACEAAAKDKLFKDLNALWEKADAKVQEKAAANVREQLWGAALKLVQGGATLEKDFAAWSAVLQSPLPGWDGTTQPLKPGTPQLVTAWLLARKGLLRHAIVDLKEIGGKVEGRSAFFSKDNVEVSRLGVAADRKTITLEGTAEPLKADPAELEFPDSTARMTLRDALNLLEGRVRWGPGYLKLTDARVKVQEILAKGAELTADDRKRLEELRDWTGAMADLLSNTGSSDSLTELRGWASAVITGCTDTNKAVVENAGITCPDKAASEAALFFGFTHVADSPFRYVQNHLRAHLDAVTQWSAPGGVQVEMKELVLSSAPPPTQVRMTIEHRSFVTQLVTPVLGHTWIPLEDRTGSLFSLGFQLSLRPNPVDQPMWSNGREDFWRIPALELGVGLKSGFDPRGRAKGLGVLGGVPVFAGVALRPLPYFSISGGAAILSNRHSVLGVEQSKVGLAPYINLSLQVNAIDAVRAAYSDSIASVVKVVP